MNFNSAAYGLLVAVVLVGYYALRDHRRQNYLLLAAGLYFYGSWDYRFLFLLLYSASVDYIGGLGIVHERPLRHHAALFVAIMSAATFLLLAPIDWQSVLALAVPDHAYSGGWVEPLRWRQLFLPDGEWRNLTGGAIALAVLGLTTVIGYRLSTARQPKYFLCVSLTANLILLGFFKYFDFFAATAADALNRIGFGNHDLLIGIIVPAGISFYTFQAMSYSIDVYRGQLRPTHRFTDYLLFVSFFPHLVAGPIQEANWLLPQLQRPRSFDWTRVQAGVFLIGWGLFKKIFIADNVARFVAPAFDVTAQPLGPEVLVATYAFALQIYADFSAYSDIARGTSRLLGIELTVNFNLPYLARNPRDFWRRWHISLSTWLRDYLYVGLGGNRHGRVYRNLLLTMVLGGLWHGARMNFVGWGLYQGLLLCLHRWLEPTLDRITPKGHRAQAAFTFLSWLVFFHLVCYGWLLFRAETGAQIVALSGALLTGWTDAWSQMGIVARLLWFSWPLLLMQVFQARSRNLLVAMTWPWPVRVGVYVTLFYLVVIFGSIDGGEFIYFQF
jgi:alginate O-acetyltransferase complex protein AlgI